MAKDKKGFILYADQKELFEQLPNDKAGELIKFIFSYVNDENPKTDDLILNMAFIPIKQQFKRDLVKWESTRKARSQAGKASAEARKKKKQELTNSTNVSFVKQTPTKPTVKDNVTVTDTVKDIKENKFNIFWSAYPTKTAKKSCLTKWHKLKDKDIEKILSTINSYVSYKPFKDYTHPNPMTYLNQERWNDVVPIKKQQTKRAFTG